VQVLFGSVQAQIVNMDGDSLVVTVPENATSRDVTVKLPNGRTLVFVNAFRYGADAPDQWDRVLFPTNFTGRGAHGSEWHTDIVIRNDSPVRVDTEPLFWFDPASPVTPPMTAIEPGGRGNFFEEQRDGGRFLYVPRGLESWFAYSSHAVDRSRSTTDLGTEMPVVRAEDTSRTLRFVEIPVDPRYRAKLRIYDFDATNLHTALVMLRNPQNDQLIAMRDVRLTGAPICASPLPCFASQPSFGYLDLEQLPELRGAGAVDVWVYARRGDARLWAFVSITNNETQAVTLHTPQHKAAK
jgi:hypothetical protein